jgi:hypothetical protein
MSIITEEGTTNGGTVNEDSLWRAREVKGQCNEMGRPRNRRRRGKKNLSIFLAI